MAPIVFAVSQKANWRRARSWSVFTADAEVAPANRFLLKETSVGFDFIFYLCIMYVEQFLVFTYCNTLLKYRIKLLYNFNNFFPLYTVWLGKT